MSARSRLAARLVITAGASLLVGWETETSAHPGVTGYSGKPYNGMSETCTTNCHATGGAAPTLTITAPTTVQAGSTTSVTIVVAGNKSRTSMNAAFSDGVKTIEGANTDTPLPVEEPTEVAATVPPPNGATGTYKFSFIAPQRNGPVTMWVAGMAASGNGTGGDGIANATRTITVIGAVAPPTPDAGTPDADALDAGAVLTDGGGRGGGADPEPRGSAVAPSASSDAPPDPDGGCAVAATNDWSSPAAALAVIVALSLVRRRRAR
jgi:MYXO-CTERM domain-containing protein